MVGLTGGSQSEGSVTETRSQGVSIADMELAIVIQGPRVAIMVLWPWSSCQAAVGMGHCPGGADSSDC